MDNLLEIKMDCLILSEEFEINSKLHPCSKIKWYLEIGVN